MSSTRLFVSGLIFVIATPVFAEVKVDFSAYARSSIQVGSQGGKGDVLYPRDGFAQHNRLQEASYFELGAKTHLEQDSQFVLTLGNDSGMPHYSGNWPGPAFAVRNFYFAFDQLPDNPTTSLWFGSRMYRGNDIYLFDTWPTDNQNMLGGGVGYGKNIHVEHAIGARADAAYSGAGLTAANGQRYFFINKLEIPVTGEKKLKTNLEFHLLPKTTGSYNTGVSTSPIDIPSSTGLMLAAQYPFWGSNTGFIRYGSGDVVAGSVETRKATLQEYPGLSSRKGSRVAGAGLSNAMELDTFNAGVMYAVIGEWVRPRDSAGGTSVSSAIRPMYYVTQRLHAGFELDGVHYFKKLTDGDIDYLEISPMLEYALNRNVYGSPKFRLIASEAFYAQDVTKYGETVRNAFNIGAGFEVWF